MNPAAARIENLIVVKIGGGAGVDLAASAADLAELARQRPLIIVHGASARMNALCEARGIAVRTLTSPSGHSSRYTDPQVRDVFVEAAGQINEELHALMQQHGIAAQRHDGALQGERKTALRAIENGRIRVVRDDYSGSITQVNTHELLDLLAQGYTPLVPPLAHSADSWLNVDGDRAAAALATALGAAELVILSNVPGLYRRFGDEASLISQVRGSELETALGWAEGRMKRKVLGAIEALQGGVQRVRIADGRHAQPVQRALQGGGTEFIR